MIVPLRRNNPRVSSARSLKLLLRTNVSGIYSKKLRSDGHTLKVGRRVRIINEGVSRDTSTCGGDTEGRS